MILTFFDNSVVLTDENGEDVSFEFLSLIEYQDENYIILLPDDDSEEVVILRIDFDPGDEEPTYTSVDDEDVLQAVFKKFKEEYKDSFNFID